ncbi:MAG: hypothetical protein U0269_27750 [Polyangiales bacterium]
MNRLTRSLYALSISAAVLSSGACKKPQVTQDAAPRALPPPTRPANLLMSAHFGHPMSSVRRLAALASMNVPFELGMSLVLGFDSTMLAAIDLDKPADVVVTGTPDERDVTVAFFPAAQTSLRSTLSTRFRLTTVEGVGERLDLRAPSNREQAWRCAIVGAPGEVSSRLVCSTSERALSSAARWTALVSSQRATEGDDGVLDIDGTSARAGLAPYLRRIIDQSSAMLGTSAQQARDEHTSAPDFGDPEPLVNRARSLSTQVDAMVADLRSITIKLTIESNALVLDATGSLDAAGTSTIAQGTARAISMPTAHPLTGRLAPDSSLAGGWRTPAEALRAHLQNAARMALDVLGSRVPSPELAQADFEALFAHVGDEVAFSLSRGPAPAQRRAARPGQEPEEPALGPWEFTALASQEDNATGALAVLPRISRAAWLRGMRFGTAAPTVTAARNAVVLRIPPRPEPIAQPGERQTARAPQINSELGLAVSQGQLAIVWGSNVRDQLRRLDLRTAGPAPNVLASGNDAPFVFGVDARALRGESPPAPLRLSWSASREGSTLESRFHLSLSEQVLRMLRRARRPE